MPVFYTSKIDDMQAILDEQESRHIIMVLRMTEGDTVQLVDGKGNYCIGIISVPDPKACRVQIHDITNSYLHRDYYLHVAIAPTKSADRFEWFLEKATEIGVDEISPIICARSERNRIRYDRSQKIIITAMKQCGRAMLPRLNREISVKNFLTQSSADIKLLAHSQTDREQYISAEPVKDLRWIIMIGPEGDFTPREIEQARQMTYREINLGEAVYRTETAGIMACHTISSMYQNRI